MSAMNMPLLSPCGWSQGGTVAAGMCVVVVVTKEMIGNDGQCLATICCQTLQLLIISVVIISKHVNYIIN